MSRQEIITDAKGRDDALLRNFEFPPGEGHFIGTLVHRAWHYKKPCLVCYFETVSGEKFKLMAWWQRKNGLYTPKQSGICFANDVANGSRWRCTFDRAKGGTGSSSWLTAEEDISHH